MKAKFLCFLGLACLITLSTGCLKDSCTRTLTYEKANPIYLKTSDYRVDINMEAPKTLVTQGKIYFYNDFILINEPQNGIHVINNTSPENPQPIGFLPIQGNLNMAVRNDILYADSYTDLLAINFSDVLEPELIHRSLDIFPHFGVANDGTILVGYSYETVTEEVNCDSWNNRDEDLFSPTILNSFGASSSSGNDNSVGVGGSLARFTIAHGHMYTIDDQTMRIFDLSDAQNPSQTTSIVLGWGIETIFPYEDKLFIGANNGMTIYDLSNPGFPTYVSGYSHWTSCDPVFVKDNFAYVTLRSGTNCNGSIINQLDLLDISNISNPILIKSFEMDNPHGLSIVDNSLFLCEGQFGLKVFDISTPEELNKNLKDKIKKIHAVDVIAIPGNQSVVMVIGTDGLYQFDYSNPNNLKQISFIPTANY